MWNPKKSFKRVEIVLLEGRKNVQKTNWYIVFYAYSNHNIIEMPYMSVDNIKWYFHILSTYHIKWTINRNAPGTTKSSDPTDQRRRNTIKPGIWNMRHIDIKKRKTSFLWVFLGRTRVFLHKIKAPRFLNGYNTNFVQSFAVNLISVNKIQILSRQQINWMTICASTPSPYALRSMKLHFSLSENCVHQNELKHMARRVRLNLLDSFVKKHPRVNIECVFSILFIVIINIS